MSPSVLCHQRAPLFDIIQPVLQDAFVRFSQLLKSVSLNLKTSGMTGVAHVLTVGSGTGDAARLSCLCSLGPGVYFGQLLGMADHLSFTLGRAGYRIHKIVPYGPVHETLQYLIRCASTFHCQTRRLDAPRALARL
jgi:proline dehydrogenase